MSTKQLPESADANPVLDELIEDFAVRLQNGGGVSADSFIEEHPEQAAALQDVLPVIQLLADLDRSGSPIDQAADPKTALGELGDFRLIREIGRGGMGIVYEAQQISLGRRVALKVLPFAGALDAKQLQRFQNEAHAAGLLHHTNIVPVYYVGCERGVHFYAMQLIEGQTLAWAIRDLRRQTGLDRTEDRPAASLPASIELFVCDSIPDPSAVPPLPPTLPCHVDEHPSSGSESHSTLPIGALSTEGSIKTRTYFRAVANLGVQAAAALEHAHEVGVVHRDIKPANLLIDHRGNLWITDFGLAQFQNKTGPTLTGDLIGTLRYMSPEQALAQRANLDHRTDIYSLGATLYELVTLEPAFNGRDRQELLRKIAFEEPRAPRRLNSAIPADLETILLKALSKDPSSRYATAKEMADDLRRFLQDEPIRARRPTFVQKAAKWIRRHRVVVRTTVLALMLGLAACSFVFWRGQVRMAAQQERTEEQRRLAEDQRRRAQVRLDLARQALDEMFSQVHKWMQFEPWSAPEQRRFLSRTLVLYRKIAEEEGTTPAELYRTAEAHHRMAQINLKLWNLQGAEAAADQAILRLGRLTEDCPQEPRYLCDLAAAHLVHGEVLYWACWYTGAPQLRNDKIKKAEAAIRSARTCLDGLSSTQRETPANQYQLALCHYHLGKILALDPRRHGEADRAFGQAQKLCTQLAVRDQAKPDYPNLLAAVCTERGNILIADRRLAEAERTLRESVALMEQLTADSKLLPDFREDLGLAHKALGSLFMTTGRLVEAEAAYRRASHVYEKLAESFPHVSRYHGNLASVQDEMVKLLHMRGELNEARTLAEAAVHHQHVALEAYPEDWSFRLSLQSLNTELGSVLVDLRELERATVAANEVADIIPGCPIGAGRAMRLFAAIVRLAEQDKRLAPKERAAIVKKYLARESEMRPRFFKGCHPYPWLMNEVAWYLATYPDGRFRDPDRASVLAKEAVSAEPQSAPYWNTLGVARYRRGDWKGARAALEKAIKLNAGGEPTDALFLAMAHGRLGQTTSARQWLNKADELIQKNGRPTEEVRRFRAEAGLLLQITLLGCG